jgi:hypothetical protein
MKKTLGVLSLIVTILTLSINSAQAGETGEPVGGFAIVNPETGVVHGVITGSIEYFGNNDKTMESEYMGCPVGCLIVQQSTSDKNGNIGGVHGPGVTYDDNRNIFKVEESNTSQVEVVTESASNVSAVETEIVVSRSARNYEFGVQNFADRDVRFQMTEVEPSQNTSVLISATTNELICKESQLLCSSKIKDSSTKINEESIYFNERKTTEQILSQMIVEAKNKIKAQLNLINAMIEKWLIK